MMLGRTFRKSLRRSWQKKTLEKQGSKIDRKSTRLNSSHTVISYAVFCLKKKKYRNAHRSRSEGREDRRGSGRCPLRRRRHGPILRAYFDALLCPGGRSRRATGLSLAYWV